MINYNLNGLSLPVILFYLGLVLLLVLRILPTSMAVLKTQGACVTGLLKTLPWFVRRIVT